MKLFTLGTSAGTEPFPKHHHTSLAIETEKGVYFFDAGECAGYTAHLSGVDLLKTRAVFITHPHMDHVGGLGNLLWYIRKMTFVRKAPLSGGNIDIYTPSRETVDGFMMVLRNSEGGFVCEHTHTIYPVQDGLLFDNGDISVTAVYTNHIKGENGEPISYAYQIRCEGKTITFSGDMCIDDLPRILPETSDVFLVETGHHQIEDVCTGVIETGKTVKRLFFVHHGGYIMRDPEAALARAKAAFGDAVEITMDGNCYEI